MVLLGLVIGFQSGVISDTRLRKPSDFDVSLRQITDFCAEVSSSSGVKFTVDKKVQDLKVDIFVENRPLAETMDKVAKVLSCEWIPVEKGYRLEMDVKTANRERNFLLAEAEEEKKQLQTKIWAWQYIAKVVEKLPDSLGQFELENKVLQPFENAVREAYATNDTTNQMDANIKREAIREGLRNFYFGRVLLQFDKDLWERFWRGEPFAASTFPNSRFKLYESDMRSQNIHSYALRDGKTVQGENQQCLFFRYDLAQGKIKANKLTFSIPPKEYGEGSFSSSKSEGGFKYRSTLNPIPQSLMKLPFYEDLKLWRDVKGVSAKFPHAVDNKTPTWKSPWVGQRRRLGEHLRWLHMATRIPIVAQADRSCTYHWVKLDRGHPTASKYLQYLMEQSDVFAREENGFLLSRNFRYWNHRQHEAPEVIWESFEPKEPKVKLTLDELAIVALKLREDQIVSEEMSYPLSRFDLTWVERSYDSLRFYGALSKTQRASANTPDGIRLGDLDSNQQQLLKTSVTNLIMESGFCSHELAKSLVTNGKIDERLRELRFKIKIKPNVHTNTSGSDLTDGEETLVKFVPENYIATASEFRFEFSEKEVVTQSIDFRQ